MSSPSPARLTRRQFSSRLLLASAAAIGVQSLTGIAADDNAIVLNLEPTRGFPRNSEGSFVTLNSGRILFFYTQFYGGSGDENAARIVGLHSEDGGRSWSREPKTVVENEAAANVMSVSLLRLQSGAIALFYLVKNSMLDCRPVMRVSHDEAATWSEPKRLTDAPGYFVLNNDRVIQLTGGRLVVPLAFHRGRGGDPKSYKSLDFRAIALWLLSDDEGKTWREAATWWALPARSATGLQEPGVVELSDGRLFGWMRTDQGCQYGSYSSNHGEAWQLPEKTALQSPESPASIKRIPGSSELLAVFNDHSGKFPFPKGKRTPLVTAISSDDGRTWGRRKVIESDRDGWYCYTAIHFSGDAALIAYCAGDPKVGGLNRLRLRRIPVEWLTAKGA